MAGYSRRVRRRRRLRSGRFTGFTPARVAISAASLIAGFAVGMVLLTYGPDAYKHWHEERQLRQASALLAQKDFEGALQAAREVLQSHSNSLAAFHVLAEASESLNRPETVAWRAQIARLQPQDLDSQLNLASAALRFSQLDVAREALQRVAPADRDRAPYHVVAGWLARAQGNEAEVERNFAEAAKQEPGNELYQFNLAVLRIRSDSPEKNKESREVLERLSKSPSFRTEALRSLLDDAVQREDLERADTLAQDLQMSQQVTFPDYLLCLDLYRKLNQEKFSALLTKVKSVATRSPTDVAVLMEWLNKNGMAADLLKWVEKLPSQITTSPPPAIAIADAFVEIKNWSRLKRWTRSGEWGDDEYLRLAYQAYASKQSRQSGGDAEFSSLWHSAERAATDQPSRELRLARLAAKWSLPAEAEQLWLRVSKETSARREALDALYGIYRTNNDLPNLHRIAQRLYESSPSEPALAANYARFSLLIEQSTAEGHRVAKEAYDVAPTDPNIAVTYAFSLYGQGRSAEGVEVLRKLPPEELSDSHLAVYAAVLFLDENQVSTARGFVTVAQSGSVFPEEKRLLDEVTAKMNNLGPDSVSVPAPSATPGH